MEPTPNNSESEQRRSYRCPVPEPQQEAILRWNRHRLPVRLYNESCGGYAALANSRPELQIGQLAELQAKTGHFCVRIVYVTLAETGGQAAPLYHIGLERVDDLTTMPGGHARAAALEDTPGRPGLGIAIPVVGTVLAIALLLGGWAVVSSKTGLWGPRWYGDARLNLQGADKTLSTIVQQVGLTRTQQTLLEEVSQRAARALQDIDAFWKDDSPEERKRKQMLLLEAAKAEIFNMLNREQRDRWKVLVE